MKIVFAGTPTFAVPFLVALFKNAEHKIVAVCTQPDHKAGRGQKLTASAIKEKALELHLPLLQPDDWRTPKLEQQLKELSPDILIDVACGALIPPNILSLPRYGCINVHPSLLPRWRGAAPLQRAILEGDEESGITIMQMSSGLDSGDILKQARIAVTPQTTTAILTAKLINLGVPLLLQTLQIIAKSDAAKIRMKQDNALSTYAAKLIKEEARIDWGLNAEKINCMIRAFNPAPGAYSSINNIQVKIWQAAIITKSYQGNAAEIRKEHAIAGTITNISANGIDVATGEGILRILKLQLAGKKMMLAKDVVNGRPQIFKIGNKFV